jgi:hypothetical protein
MSSATSANRFFSPGAGKAYPSASSCSSFILACLSEKINAVLTPDQQAKWKQMRQEMMEKHKEMKDHGQMDHQ